jgi:hypothetical protein
LGRLAVTGEEAIDAVCTRRGAHRTFEPERALVDAYADGFPHGVNCVGRATSIASISHSCLFGIALRRRFLFNA